MLRYECHRNSPWCEEGEKAFFVPTACFLAQVRHHTTHYKRRAPAGETARLGWNFWSLKTTLAQELCGRSVRWLSCASGRDHQSSWRKSCAVGLCGDSLVPLADDEKTQPINI